MESTRKINRLLSEYGENHQNKTNKLIHWICIPLIFFSIFGLIRCIPVPGRLSEFHPLFNWAGIIIILALLYYLTLSFSLFIGFLIWCMVVVAGNEWILSLGSYTLLITSCVIFIFAWVGQFIGHHIEGKKPSFFKDLQFLLIGPAWLMAFIFKRIGLPL